MTALNKQALNPAELESALLELKRISEQPAVSTHYARVLRKHIANLNFALEAAEHTAAVDHEAACSLVEENEEVKRKLEAAEKRIAELEGRAFNPAILDVIAERQRQKTTEGWTPEHDDQYGKSQLLWASSCYLLNTIQPFNRIPMDWPWDSSWWKPTNPRRDLVKAGALIIAEIERIDRAAEIGVKGE